jgi:thiosulfate dehydrogenase [quinone] large subunit
MSKKKAARVEPQRVPVSVTDRRVAYATLPLRLFLGVTFVYAGLQKISDPGFLQPGAPTYIGTQLQAFSAHSPIGFVLQWLALPAPQLAGVAVILAELAIGLAVLLGFLTRWAAAAGALLSFVLFLTASWTVQPYFLGSDSLYTVAWITLVLVGDQGVLLIWAQLLRLLGVTQAPPRRPSLYDARRRRLLLQIGGGAVALVWLLAVLPRPRFTPQASTTPTPSPASTPTATPSGSPSPSSTPSSTPTPPGTLIGSVADLQSQGSLSFNDPKSGDPSLVVQISGGSVVAFDALCTHQQCTVQYDTTQKLFVCPCHNAEFDPAHGAAVVAGPAPTPLGSIKVQVSGGSVYTA